MHGAESLTELRWLAVYCKPGLEDIAEFNLRRQAYRVFFPWLPVQIEQNHHKPWRRQALFARYLFVGCEPGRSIAPIGNSVGVSGIVSSGRAGGPGNEPVFVPPEVISMLIDYADFDGRVSLETPENSRDEPRPGEIRRIVAGAFVDQLAEVADSVDRSGHVRILLGQLRASIPAADLGGLVSARVR
jgi:transcription antitermination factor NusG